MKKKVGMMMVLNLERNGKMFQRTGFARIVESVRKILKW